MPRFLSVIPGVLLASIVALSSTPVYSQSGYPARQIHIIVPFPPGGINDIAARIISVKLAEALGQSVVVDNRGGAGGIIGTELAAQSAPDGYALILGSVATHAINQSLHKQLPYNVMRDFSPITNIINTQNIVVVNPSLPVHSVQELIAFAKSRQNPLNYGSAGIGTAMHLSVELFNAMTGIKMVHVPYRGGGPAINDLLAGRVDVVFAPLPDALPQVKAGRLRALAVTGKQRSPTVPELPTIAEAGVPGYDFSGWSGMFAPARTPPEIVTRLYAETLKILRSPEIKQRLSTLGAEPGGMPPPEFSAFVRAEIAKWGNVIKEAKIPQIK